MKIDKKLIKELVNCLSEFNITEIEHQDGEKKIKVSRSQKVSPEQTLTRAVVSPNKSELSDKKVYVQIEYLSDVHIKGKFGKIPGHNFLKLSLNIHTLI